MRTFGKWLGRVLFACVALGVLAYFFGPYEDVDTQTSFESRKFGEGVQVYFESVESLYDDLTPGVEKRVIWANGSERRTPLSILYVHGFSATSEEIRPVPDTVANAFGANLVFTRLTGHGRSGDAMAEASINDWMYDMAEGLAAARAVGDEVIVIATSTGGTLMTQALFDAELSQAVKGVVFMSPNFGINDPAAPLLGMPAARYILPLLVGKTRSWEAANPMQEKYWTTSYPTVAGFPVGALVKHVVAQDFSELKTPALFHFSLADQVVRGDVTAELVKTWGGPVQVEILEEGAEVSSSRHVIAGDILSPARTALVSEMIINWIKGL